MHSYTVIVDDPSDPDRSFEEIYDGNGILFFRAERLNGIRDGDAVQWHWPDQEKFHTIYKQGKLLSGTSYYYNKEGITKISYPNGGVEGARVSKLQSYKQKFNRIISTFFENMQGEKTETVPQSEFAPG